MQKAKQYKVAYKEPIKEVTKVKPHKQTHVFNNGHQLVINKTNDIEYVEVLNTAGEIQVTIEMTPKGSVIKLSGNIIKIDAKEKFTVESPVIELKASQTLHLKSDGDMHQEINRDSFNTARIQNITADLGNVNIVANDDVKLDGETVKLNCNHR